MKTKLLCLLLLLGLYGTPGFGQAQSAAAPPPSEQGDPLLELQQMTGSLETGRIPTGVLLDRMMLMTDPHRFTGRGDTMTDYRGFNQQYWEFYNASLNSAALPTPAALESRISQRLQQGAVPLLLLRYDYNEISPTAFRDRLLTADSVNGRVLDGPDRSRSPYATGQFFSATLPVPATESTVNIYVGPEFWLGNTAAPSTLAIDFGDGQGERVVPMGSTVQVRVNTAAAANGKLTPQKPIAQIGIGGFLPIVIIVRVVDGIIKTAKFARAALSYYPLASLPPDMALGVLASRKWAGYTPSKGIHGPNGQATAIAWIKYAAGNTSSPRKLRRPLRIRGGNRFSRVSQWRCFRRSESPD